MKSHTIQTVIWDADGVVFRCVDPEPVIVADQMPFDQRQPFQSGCALDRDLIEVIQAMQSSVEMVLWIENWVEVWQTIIYQDEIQSVFDRLVVTRGDPAILPETLCSLGIPPAGVVLVGNTPQVVEAACAAGLQAILYHDPAQVCVQLLERLVEPYLS